MHSRFLTAYEVATFLKIHPLTVLRYIKEGNLKAIKLGRVYRIRESDVEQFLEDNVV